jgi:adenosylcobinamide-GDP ribazoletransferase
LILPIAAGWGRWGQQVAIARYPYLKPTGKGAFHQAAIRSLWDTVPAGLLLLGLCALPLGMSIHFWKLALGLTSGGIIAFLIPAWFNRQLGGHTGDTYGAVVEWTEALFLLVLAVTQGLAQF